MLRAEKVLFGTEHMTVKSKLAWKLLLHCSLHCRLKVKFSVVDSGDLSFNINTTNAGSFFSKSFILEIFFYLSKVILLFSMSQSS